MEYEATQAIAEMVDRETEAWNRKDADTLVSLFHQDMVWPWPSSSISHDPAEWTTGMGRFDADRWRSSWQKLFDMHDLVSNHRNTVRVQVTPEGDAGFAVVDVDTIWRRHTDGTEQRWHGRACKVYVRCDSGWKMTMHTGLLRYD
jgi:ketosteroid isomerase-like protein